MGMPTAPTANTSATAAASPAAVEVDDDAKAAASAIKQFGPSTNADGEAIAVPTVAGIDLTVVANKMYASLTATLAELGVTDVSEFIEKLEEIDKTLFPGNKAGRTSYATIRNMGSVQKQYEVLNKERGVGGAAALKTKIAEKDSKIAELEAKLAALIAASQAG